MTDKLGLVPPQAIELEAAVLGAMMLEKNASYIGLKIVQPKHFYLEKHVLICKAIQGLTNKNEPIDILTVIQQLKSNGHLESVGGAHYISQLTDRVASSAHIEAHCRIIIQKFLSREIIRTSTITIKEGYKEDTDVFDLIAKTSADLHDLSKGLSGSKVKSISEVVDELRKRVSDNMSGIISGIPTGVGKYDAATGGQQKGNMIVYAGRPGMGKSARMCNEAYHQLKKGYSVIIHSLEMTEAEVAARIVALETGIEPEKILKRKISDTKVLFEGFDWLSKQKLKILTNNNLSSIVVESHITQAQIGCDIVYIDYIQIVRNQFTKSYDVVTETSKEIKQLAKSLDCPVVALAQLSRSVETRGGDKKPILSDLKESGQIEQDADVVEFLYRPEYYEIFQDEEGNDLRGQCHYINAKMRGGTPNITTIMKWEGAMNRLTSIKPEFNASVIDGNASFDNEKDDLPF